MVNSKPKRDASFGVVPIHEVDGERRYLLVQHHAGHWGFPKGHAEGSESPVEAAVRELSEETGLVVTTLLDDQPLTEAYRFTKRDREIHKTVTYFVGYVESDAVTPQAEEVCECAWGTYDQTRDRLTFAEGRQLLDRVEKILATHS